MRMALAARNIHTTPTARRIVIDRARLHGSSTSRQSRILVAASPDPSWHGWQSCGSIVSQQQEFLTKWIRSRFCISQTLALPEPIEHKEDLRGVQGWQFDLKRSPVHSSSGSSCVVSRFSKRIAIDLCAGRSFGGGSIIGGAGKAKKQRSQVLLPAEQDNPERKKKALEKPLVCSRAHGRATTA